jgi:hypothetical protein
MILVTRPEGNFRVASPEQAPVNIRIDARRCMQFSGIMDDVYQGRFHPMDSEH